MSRLVLVLFVVVSACASKADADKQADKQQPAPEKKPAPDKGPAAPSTGKELAKAEVAIPADKQAAIAREGIKQGDCKGHVHMMAAAMAVGGPKLTKDEQIAGYVMLQKCARVEKAWNAVLQASGALLDLAPDKSRPTEIIQAFLGMDDEAHAKEMLKLLVKTFPNLKAELTGAASLIVCHSNDFKACNAASAKMLEVLKKEKTPPGEALLENLMFHAFSSAALGNYAAYEADLKTLHAFGKEHKLDVDKGLAPFTTKAEQARTAQLFVDYEKAQELPLGTYHFMTGGKVKDAGQLLQVRLINQTKKQRDIKLAVEVTGVTETLTVTVPLPPNTQVNRSISPPLKMDFDVAKLRAPRDSQLAVHITDAASGKSLYDESFKISVLPHDHLPLRRNLGSDKRIKTPNNALAFVTPNAKELEPLIAKAKLRIDDGGQHAFTGDQRATTPQVKALFEELKAHGVSYVMDPAVFDPQGQVQRTRLPAEALASTNAQCLEGTLLYASLMESIGLRPLLVFVPGHAFIAWRPSKFDKTKHPFYFLETTMTGGPATFEHAMEHAEAAFLDEVKKKDFDIGEAALVDVAKLRAEGYTAQPY